MKISKFFFILFFALGLLTFPKPAAAELDYHRLSNADVVTVKELIHKLEPIIRRREAERPLATLTFDELYGFLTDDEAAFLRQFAELKGEDLGVTIPFRQIATGKEELTTITGQVIFMDGKPVELPPQYLPPHVYNAYLEMMEAMEEDLGRRLYIESGYRSSAYQLYLFVYYLKNHDYSILETTRWVALPGYSEHGAPDFQALDFINQDGISGETDPEEFENLPEYTWLLKNAARFDFVLSYPRGTEGITFEPWHWRYEGGQPPKESTEAGDGATAVHIQLGPLPALGQLPNTTPQMHSPGYWISRHPDPDAIVLTQREVAQFNSKLQNESKLTIDLLAHPTIISGEALKNELYEHIKTFQNSEFIFADGQKPAEDFWANISTLADLSSIPDEVPVRYGLIAQFADQKFLPVEEGLYESTEDLEFDELQNSALDIGTPILILYVSTDKKWSYVHSAISSGWVKSEHVGESTKEDFDSFLTAPFIVTTSALTDIYSDQKLRKLYGAVRMGVRLPLIHDEETISNVLIPMRNEDGQAELSPGFVSTTDISHGYLSYTPRNVILQAFKLLGQPYGWGGKNVAQDCSRFIQEVFATFGIQLPRDSKNQIQTGVRLVEWNEFATNEVKQTFFSDKAIGGVTLLGMKGHIMLYLGSVDGKAYAIHSVWAYRQPTDQGDQVMVINRVALSDLTLGEGSERGSWLKRLNAVRLIGLDQ